MPGRIRTYHDLDGDSSDLGDQVAAQAARVEARLAAVERVIAVMSGKGGVGKSLVASLLATSWAREGLRVGLLDADLNGPSTGRLLAARDRGLEVSEEGVVPARGTAGVRLMSMALLVEPDRALSWHEPGRASHVWRGAQERGALREFLSDVLWGELDVLVVDLPPGSQRLDELGGLVPELAGVLAVTLPSGASADAVARSLDLARQREFPILGVVENMAGHACAACGATEAPFAGEAGKRLSRAFDAPLLARIPLEPGLGAAADSGRLDAWLAGATAGAREVSRLATRALERADAVRKGRRA